MESTIEKISAVTLRVANMMESVRFTKMFFVWSSSMVEDAGFSSLRTVVQRSEP